VSALVWAAWAKPAVRIVYNASDSAPRGLYIVSPAADLQVGDYVVARLPEATANFAATRDYLPRFVPVLKQIAALPGQQVCIRNGSVYVDGTAVARTLNEDGKRRPLSPWKACRPLVDGEIFLLNSGNPASFDSRYFGPVDVSFVRGRAVHL
jgi:conjugative transfer signal peptidase TraF